MTAIGYVAMTDPSFTLSPDHVTFRAVRHVLVRNDWEFLPRPRPYGHPVGRLRIVAARATQEPRHRLDVARSAGRRLRTMSHVTSVTPLADA